DMKKLKENVHAIQVGCQTCEGAYLDKDCPLNEEVKGMEEVKYREFSRPFPNNIYDGFSDNEEQETDDSGMAEAVAALEATLKKKREEPKKVKKTINYYVDPYEPPIPFPKRLEHHAEEALRERFGDKEDDLEDPEECEEDKANTILGAIHDKLNDDWFNNTGEDKEDLEGLLDYLKPESYDRVVDLDNEAYIKRRCKLLGMTYKEPTPIRIEKAKVTRYTVFLGETYTKVKVLGVEEIPRIGIMLLQ
ncbi:hypothetical protein Tco_1532381, partial [Tanacetum coccineum]